jgi:hypothetical protein
MDEFTVLGDESFLCDSDFGSMPQIDVALAAPDLAAT